MIDNHLLIETLTGLIIFQVGNIELATDIKEVSAIVNPNELDQSFITQVKGLSCITINNLVIPLIDLQDLLGFKGVKNKLDRRILIIEIENKVYGFLVEKIKEILTMSKELKYKIEFVPEKKNEIFLGKLYLDDRIFYLPDFQNIVHR